MKAPHCLLSSLLLCLLGLIPGMVFAQADGVPKRSPELQVLDRYVGLWDIKITIRPVGGEEVIVSVVSRRSWSRGGTFVQFQDTNLTNPEAKEFQLLWTYDPVAKNYPAVFMDGPTRGELAGVWDAQTNTMHWKGKSEVTAEGHDRFIGQDRIESSGVFKNAEGETLAEISWSRTRRKVNSPKK